MTDTTDIPGSVGELNALASNLRAAADRVQDGKSIVVADQLLDWKGAAGNAFRGALERFPAEFERANTALGDGARAISTFANELEGFQRAASTYEREIDASQEALSNATARHEAAKDALQRETRAAASNPLLLLNGTVGAAKAAADQAASLVDTLTSELHDWQSKVTANYQDYQNAVRACANVIDSLMSGITGTSGIHNGHINIQPITGASLNLTALNTAVAAVLKKEGYEKESTEGAAAVAWAKRQQGPVYDGYCLTFVSDAWGGAAAINKYAPTFHGADNSANYPSNFWDALGSQGARYPKSGDWSSILASGGTPTQGVPTPPPGALVFFQGTPKGRNTYSHVELSLGNGQLISTGDGYKGHDSVDANNVHIETLSDQPSTSTYIGWWLPPS